MKKWVIAIVLVLSLTPALQAQGNCSMDEEAWAYAKVELDDFASQIVQTMQTGTELDVMLSSIQASAMSAILLMLEQRVTCTRVSNRFNKYHEFAYWALLSSTVVTQTHMHGIAQEMDSNGSLELLAEKLIGSYVDLGLPLPSGRRS